MTPSFIHNKYVSCQLNDNTAKEKVSKEPNGNIVIDFGEIKFCGNREEDFERLIACCRVAIQLLNPSQG